MIRVLVVDDQPMIRDAIAALVGGAPGIEVIGTASDGLAAIREARRLVPNVVLMDIRMPRLDGVEATRQLRALPEPPAVVILTTFGLDEYVLAAIRAGAAGFLLKDGDADELIAGIRAVGSGNSTLAPSAMRALVDHVASSHPPDHAAALAIARLTDREREVLVELASGRTNPEIAQRLVISEATAKTHVSNVLSKLGVRDRTQAAVTAHLGGLM